MANYKVPSQAASGGDSFSDALVGNQITTGSDQMTGSNFAIEKAIPEKDSKQFITQPFSEFVTLEEINQEKAATSSTGGSASSTSNDNGIKFNSDKKNADRSLYGSLKQRLNVAVQNIITLYPAAILVDSSSPVSTNNNSAESASYDISTDTTDFMVQYSLLYNPLDVVLIEPKSNTLPSADNDIRNFFSAYTKYVIDLSGVTYNVLSYSEPDSNNKITLRVGGNPFNGATGSTENYLIRPNNGVVEEFYKGLDDLQTVLLNRTSSPIFNAGFNVPRETNGGYTTETITVYINWPVSRDGWNIQIVGIDYGYYIEQLSNIGDEIDAYKSNLIIRFLTAPQLFEFDTEDHKAEAIFQIYGQSFDQIKLFIDNIAYMRNISYDGINNVPDVLLKNLSETLGLSTVNLFDEKSLQDSLYTRHDTQYAGIPTGTNLIEAEYEFYRRILVNLAQLYKSKGTRNAIEFFLKFIGAPEPMIRLDEYVYKVDELLPSKDIEADIRAAIQGTKVFNVATYTVTTGFTGYTLTQLTGSTTLDRNGYPVDETTGLPRKVVDPTGKIYFETGAGWYRKTLDHRSPDILDAANSDLTSRIKTIKTMSKPFTYGEDYFDIFRQLPGLDYGYTLSSQIDNKKGEVAADESISDLTLNRKNINVFLSSDRGIDYDIYRKSRDLELTFHTLTPQTGVTFAEFLDNVLNEVITNSHVIKYQIQYSDLLQIYNSYMQTGGYSPYHYIAVNEFINRLSPYWVNIIEQFIPATTLWLGGNAIENGIFNRSKYKHVHPCTPTVYNEILYPNFEKVILEDLETIIGGGTMDGEDMSSDFRGLQIFSGVTFDIFINVNGIIYSGSTDTFRPFAGYAASSPCTIIPCCPSYLPLICSFELFNGGDSLDYIKTKWRETLTGITSTINANISESGYTITTNFYTDIDGVEKVGFTLIPNDYYSQTCNDIFDYYFLSSYLTGREDCSLEVEVDQIPLINYGDPSICQLQTDLIFEVSNNVGDEYGYGRWPTYIRTGITEDINEYPIEYISGCTYMIRGVKETDNFGIMFTDAANCEQKMYFDGLQLVIVEASPGVSGFTSSPIIEYIPTYNYGLPYGTVLYRVMPLATLPSTWEDLQTLIANGDIVEIRVENILSGYTLLSAELKVCNELTSYPFTIASDYGYQFAFDYSFVYIDGIDVSSSVKTCFINEEFEFIQNSKILVYTNMNVNLQTIPYQLEFKYPQDLQIGDLLINEFGFPIEVTGVTLDYCSEENAEELFFQVNYSGSTGTNILFNGDAFMGNKFIVSFKQENIDEITFNLHQLYQGNPPIYDPRNINPGDPICGGVPPSPMVTPSITPSRTPSVTPSKTPSVTPSITVSGTPGAIPSVTPSATPTHSITPTPTISTTSIPVTPTPSVTPTHSITPTPSVTPPPSLSITPTPTITITPSTSIPPSASITPTPTRSLLPTPTPSYCQKVSEYGFTFDSKTSTTITITHRTMNPSPYPILERGLVYSTTVVHPVVGVDPTFVDGRTDDGYLTTTVTGLTPATGYYFGAYATNACGTSYSYYNMLYYTTA